jgi:CheY-like chemotaxis protein
MATVLIADDTASVRRLVHLSLRTHHTLLEAEDGAEALELAGRHRPDIVILDVAMPVVHGLEVCRRLRAAPELPDMTTMPMSRRSGAAQARQAGADCFLEKPCLPSQIRAAVDELVREREGHRDGNVLRPGT